MQFAHLSVVWHQYTNHWTDFNVKMEMWDFSNGTLLICICINPDNISVIKSSAYHTALTFKQPTFTHANACNSIPLEIQFVYLGNKEIYSIFKTCCIICFVFHHLSFHNFKLFYANNMFFLKHKLKFKYPPIWSFKG